MEWLTENLQKFFDVLQAPAQMYLQYSLQKNQAKYAAKIAQAQAEAQRAAQAIAEARLRLLERETALREAQTKKQLTEDLVQQYMPLIITSLILLIGGAILITILTRKK